jgi:para-aminobenzoate synthetase / 4-amino-4-deoxychorismate lyase
MGSHRSHPDQQLGVFETLLVRDGRPVELDAHLERLRSSLDALYHAPVPPGTELLVLDQARELTLGRLRLTVAPNGNGKLAATARVTPVEPAQVFPAFTRAAALVRLVVPGGLGSHKWADRAIVEPVEATGSVPLILDRDDAVIEASRANVFIVESGEMVTPPADGRLLAGVTRRRLLELVPVREEPVSLDRLLGADEVFLTGSVRGVEPVHDFEGTRQWTEGTLTGVVSDHLRRHWEGET